MLPRSRLLVLGLALLVGACSDQVNPIAPFTAETQASPHPLGVQPEMPGGIEGFAFAPPLGSRLPSLEGADASLLSTLVVEICEWNGAGCASAPVRTIREGRGFLGSLRVTDRGLYWALWNTWSDRLRVGGVYRIRVLESGRELGIADVVVVAPAWNRHFGKDEKKETETEQGPHRLVLGSILPIFFVVPQRDGAGVGPAGGSVELASGAVALSVPAGALSSEVFFTAVTATNLPNGGAGIIPGTAWDLGPDGLTFQVPAVLSLRYDAALLPAGVDPGELRIHKVVNGALVQQAAGRVDLATRTVSAEVSGFSVYVVFPRNPVNPEDRQAPELRSLEVLNPATGTYGGSALFDVSGGDADLRVRLSLTDDLTGVSFLDVRFLGPSTFQVRFICYESLAPTSGSDTNGEWECGSPLPRYADAGRWQAENVFLWDRVGNVRGYFRSGGRLCTAEGQCVDPPQIDVASTPTDRSAPVVTSLQVSLDGSAGTFGPSVGVDLALGGRTIFYGFQATDDISGVGPAFRFDSFLVSLTTPSGSVYDSQATCSLRTGTPLDGFWVCPVFLPAQAATGTWTTAVLRVPDRVGNGGWASRGDWRGNGAGQVCRDDGACSSSPTVSVISAGDADPPSLQSLVIGTQGRDVTTRVRVTDNLTGTTQVLLTYRSTGTTQEVNCPASLVSGTPTDGEWACIITFSPFAALGEWGFGARVVDGAGNIRLYQRRASDGYLCAGVPGVPPTDCRDFGTTDLILGPG